METRGESEGMSVPRKVVAGSLPVREAGRNRVVTAAVGSSNGIHPDQWM
jgi:hypothetical protein